MAAKRSASRGKAAARGSKKTVTKRKTTPAPASKRGSKVTKSKSRTPTKSSTKTKPQVKSSGSSPRGNKKTTKTKSRSHSARSAMPPVVAKKSSPARGKVGSDPKAVKRVGGRRDFGIPAGGDLAAGRIERDYVSHEIKQNDPGADVERIRSGDGLRESGVGANASGPGSGSGGDIDTDFIGVGDGRGLSQSGSSDRGGADVVTSDDSESNETLSKRSAAQRPAKQRGSTVDHSGGDISTTGDGQSAGAVTNPMARNDDSFAGEIEMDEAMGADNSPSEMDDD